MKNDRSIDLGLTGYEELFMSTEERLDAKKPKVEAIPLAALTPFRNHPFKVKEDEEMAQLMRSIADAGVLSPALARPLPDGGYELISGHRRLAACKALGMDTMPVIIRDLTDEEAVITMVDSNLQREHILPSEKAFAYKMKMDAMKRKAGRLDKRLGHLLHGGVRTEKAAELVYRHLHIFHLIALNLGQKLQHRVIRESLRLAHAPQPPGLRQGRRYLIAVHHGEEHFLLRRLQIGQLHRRSQGDLALVHQLQDVGDQVGESDVALDLVAAVR